LILNFCFAIAASGYWLLAAGFQLLATGFVSTELVAGWQLATGKFDSSDILKMPAASRQ
jgi:hypothetical protein